MTIFVLLTNLVLMKIVYTNDNFCNDENLCTNDNVSTNNNNNYYIQIDRAPF